MNKTLKSAINKLFISCLFLPLISQATILSGSITNGLTDSSFIKLNTPFANSSPSNTVGADNFQTNNLYGFDEDQNVTLTQDIIDSNTRSYYRDGVLLTSGITTLTAGSTVASHYIFFDPLNPQTVKGTITFDSDIVAVLTNKTTLGNTDYLANTGVTYENPTLRGLETFQDFVSISGSTLTINFYASSPGDYVRVLTNFSPEAAKIPLPSSLILLLAGIFSLYRKNSTY